MHEEIKNTVYIAISVMILGLVLTVVGVMTFVRGQMADIRNEEFAAHAATNSFRQFNKYDMRMKDGKFIEGEGVIELLTTTYGEDVIVYVDKAKRDSTIDSILSESNGWREWLRDVKVNGGDKFTDTQIREENILTMLDMTFTNKDTDGTVVSRNIYKTFLVYNSEDPLTYLKRCSDDPDDLDLNKLTQTAADLPPHSTVTGVAVVWIGDSVDDGKTWLDRDGLVITRTGTSDNLDV